MPAACDRHRNRSVAGDGKVNHEAHRRKIKLQILPTAEAIKTLEKHPKRTNAILHGLVIVFGIFATTLPQPQGAG